jgi:hypothetical protein
MRVLAAGIRGAHVTERVFAAPLDRVWAVLADLEGSFGDVQPDMRHVRVVEVHGDRLAAVARSRFGMRARFDGVLRPGWCWLQSRFLLIGMAASSEPGGGTRVALTGGVRIPGRAALVPLGVRREARRSLDRLARRVSDA